MAIVKKFFAKMIASRFFPQNGRDAIYHKILDVKSCGFREGIHIDNLDQISIGEHCYIGPYVQFHNENCSRVIISDNVMIAPNVHFYCVSHEVGNCSSRRTVGIKFADIIVEEGCWIGADAVILQGVTIARGCIIGAGAVVTKSTDENGLYCGIPACRVKELKENGKE